MTLKCRFNVGLGFGPGRAWALALAAGLTAGLSGGLAHGQQNSEPFDVNAIQPGRQPAIDLEASPKTTTPVAPPAAVEGAAFQVSRFVVEYRGEHPAHPSIEQITGANVTLGVTPGGYVSPTPGVATVTVRVGEIIEGFGGVFHASALTEVAKAIVGELNQRGYYGVFVQAHPEDVDEITGEDLRGGQRTEMRLVIWTGVVRQVRTVASGDRFATRDPQTGRRVVQNPVDRTNASHARVRQQSPVREGDLVLKEKTDAYVYRLGRHPGRRVDVALASGESPRDVILDYVISESKPWEIYAGLSNTGTSHTNEWREEIGFAHYQLTDSDDVLRVGYNTAGFTDSHALSASYEFPLLSDTIRVKTYGVYSTYDASEVGLAGEEFSGTTWQLGAQVSGTLWQHGQFFLDGIGGARWQDVSVTNDLFGEDGQTQFLIPYVGLQAERYTGWSALNAGVMLEVSVPDLAGTSGSEAGELGRLNAEENWAVLKWNFSQSLFLEPLLNSEGYRGGPGGMQTLAHEVSVSVRGQHALGDARLIPNEQDVIGGMYSVRGYPESAAAGDTVLVASAEYRVHIPHLLPISDPGRIGNRSIGWFGEDFRWAPQQAFGTTDWDFIVKGFADAGRAIVNDKVPGEDDNTLVGVGVGLELLYRRNVSLRLDWGVALQDVDESGQTSVHRGESRLHFGATVKY
ncbi:MAG: ShlB/FhaC/HecB family hemolysin secretion/activation protein [Phycisphaerales bacterium]|nr:ShlB/FhaC/HecB family hemolysin secretion/activation protein [Phycisphaerales bacterium]